MNNNQFSFEAEEMHAGAVDAEAMAELMAEANREEGREAMREARGNDGIRPFPSDEYGSLDHRDAMFAHWVLTGGE